MRINEQVVRCDTKTKDNVFVRTYISHISYMRQRKGIEAPTPTQRANATVWDQCAVYILPILCVLLNSRGQWHEAKS